MLKRKVNFIIYQKENERTRNRNKKKEAKNKQ